MGHQRQQPLKRVGCLRQAMYQPGLVAAACRPSCALPAPSPVVQRLDCFRHGGIFCACGTVRCPKACTSRLWSYPPRLAVQYLHHALVLQAAIPCAPSLRTNFCAPGNGAAQSNKNNSQGAAENSGFARLRPPGAEKAPGVPFPPGRCRRRRWVRLRSAAPNGLHAQAAAQLPLPGFSTLAINTARASCDVTHSPRSSRNSRLKALVDCPKFSLLKSASFMALPFLLPGQDARRVGCCVVGCPQRGAHATAQAIARATSSGLADMAMGMVRQIGLVQRAPVWQLRHWCRGGRVVGCCGPLPCVRCW